MMTKRVRVAAARAGLSAIIDEVLHDGAHYVIERRGRAVAAIVPVGELEKQPMASRGHPAGALALLGIWGDVEDDAIDTFLDDSYDARSRDRGRRVSMLAI